MSDVSLKRERALIAASLVAVIALAWAYLAWLAANGMGMSMDAGMAMGGGSMSAAAQPRPWGALDIWLMFIMWTVMMVGMMLPSAMPMILLFASVNRKQRERGMAAAPVAAFVAGYLIIWTAFSLVATLLQWGLHAAALLSPAMTTASPLLGGALLVAAGIYQWTPLKRACLKHCRSPLHFVLHRWRQGSTGALRMGLEHGAFCTGCCWVLMLLLFVGGVMNLLWVAAIAAFVLLEKVAPFGRATAVASGTLLLAAGLLMSAGVPLH